REGRPTTKEILTMRMIDRSIRPMFADGFKAEVQVMSHALSYDGSTNADVCAMIGSFAACAISGLPMEYTLGAVRIGHLDGELVAFPPDDRRRTESRLDLVVSGHKDGLGMVEAGAKELPEDEIIDALEMADGICKEIVSLIEELKEKAGKPAIEWNKPEPDKDTEKAVEKFRADIKKALYTDGKHERNQAVRAVRDTVVEKLSDGLEGDEKAAKIKSIKNVFHDVQGSVERECIVEGKRTDGRASDEIRPITIEPDFIPRQHGSVLFTLGETHALVSVTLCTQDDEHIIDGIEDDNLKNFYLHYNVPPDSVGETRRFMGPGRREIGHGMLAERSLQPVLPSRDRFPYTMRIVSDIMESNGSSSMASVCGGCLAMMLAGVPLAQPVAGIAMGLVEEGKDIVILSDIQGSEDHNGDMDFKVAGSGLGITALQMDIKIKGVTRELLERALEQAKAGRKHILREMLSAVNRPKEAISEHAPRMERIKIPSDKIGFLIGPGGKQIKELQATYGVKISIMDDEGNVQVFGVDSKKVDGCVAAIQGMCETPEIGARYTGKVKSIRDFGAFIEILPGVEGLCHISELADGFVDKVNDVVELGDEVEVVVINVDDRGKVKLSVKQALEPAGSED
ncbi:MAG: polyribonucleotide nucleotidyltransferase, partial [Planctomycetota bacterium]